MLDPQKGTYIRVPAVNQAYAKGLSFWQNKVIRRYAHRQLDARTDIVALAQAKAEIRALVERDFNRKSTRGRKRHARFLEDHTAGTTSGAVSAEIVADGTSNPRETQPHPADDIGNVRSRLLNRILHRSRRPPGATLSLMKRSYRYSKPIWTCLASRRR